MILFITRYGPPLDLLFFFNDTATTEIYTLSLHDALPISWSAGGQRVSRYWTLPIDEPIYYKRADDYTDRFKELLDIDRKSTSELQSQSNLVCRLLLEKKKKIHTSDHKQTISTATDSKD